MLRIGKTETVYNKGTNPCYEIQIFLNTLSDLKWVNSYANGCNVFDKKQKNSNNQNKNEIELLYYFKNKSYVENFMDKLKTHISYETAT